MSIRNFNARLNRTLRVRPLPPRPEVRGFSGVLMITIKNDWLIIVAVFGIAIGVLLGYALKTFLG